MEDSRFIELPPVDESLVPPLLQWMAEQDEYLVDEIVGFTDEEINTYKRKASEAYDLFVRATDHILQHDRLGDLGIPLFMHDVIRYSWQDRSHHHPFLYGRFDISGGIADLPTKVIEFNADTCTMVTETLLWQPIHLHHAGKMRAFNTLEHDLITQFDKLRLTYDDRPVVLGTSLGYPEDRANIETILERCVNPDNYFTYYRDLEHVVFSEEGVFIEEDDGHIPVDIMLKLFPWDWAYTDEPELAELLSHLIQDGKVSVLSPPYTTIWQNKMFLNYITTYFPNDIIAKSYGQRPAGMDQYVVKSAFGRLGEEVTIVKSGTNPKVKHEAKSYQEYLALPRDEEGNHYQMSVFFTNEPSALNIRCSEDPIVDDDCEFYCHYIA